MDRSKSKLCRCRSPPPAAASSEALLGSCSEVHGHHSLHQGTSESAVGGNPRKQGAGTDPGLPFAKANMFVSSTEFSRSPL
ncbi:uncharacterized protein LOC121827954 isoform X3 [Peromyscus maniculatus bairdii]|uniref:uncharacterized protein LOC121827954 isoform X3 n=1 Tax=Peromyscus maniculatus bairdii TaxID=230844 RepID=UPI003FD580AD